MEQVAVTNDQAEATASAIKTMNNSNDSAEAVASSAVVRPIKTMIHLPSISLDMALIRVFKARDGASVPYVEMIDGARHNLTDEDASMIKRHLS